MQIIANYVNQRKNCLKGGLGGLECLNEPSVTKWAQVT